MLHRGRMMNAHGPIGGADNQAASVPVLFSGRDSFWAERHAAESPPRSARKKWQCRSCGECGFVEMTFGEDPVAVAHRTGHHCPPEGIVLFTPGASGPLAEHSQTG